MVPRVRLPRQAPASAGSCLPRTVMPPARAYAKLRLARFVDSATGASGPGQIAVPTSGPPRDHFRTNHFARICTVWDWPNRFRR